MDSGQKYSDGKPIYNGDMFEFEDGSIGFVFFDERIKVWSVKYRDNESGNPVVQSLEGALQYIKRHLS